MFTVRLLTLGAGELNFLFADPRNNKYKKLLNTVKMHEKGSQSSECRHSIKFVNLIWLLSKIQYKHCVKMHM